MVLLMINVILLIVGMLIDPNSAVVLFTPLLWPMAQHAGVDLIHFGIIYTVNLAIGMFSPPFGLNIFVSCSIFNVPSSKVVSGLMAVLHRLSGRAGHHHLRGPGCRCSCPIW